MYYQIIIIFPIYIKYNIFVFTLFFGCYLTITFYSLLSCSCCLYIYVRLSGHVLSAQDTGSFLSLTFGSALVQSKRNFDRFMQAQLNSIAECRVTKKKCGILPFVTNFEVSVQPWISILYTD